MSRLHIVVAMLGLACATPSRSTVAAAPAGQPADAVSAYHDGFNRGDPGRVRGAIADAILMTVGAYSVEPREWQAHQFLAGVAVDRWVTWMLRETGPFVNHWDVVKVSSRNDAAIVVTRETGRNRFRTWTDAVVTWHLGRDGGSWRIVGMFIRDVRNPETDRAREETTEAIRALGGTVEIDDSLPGRPVTKIDLHETAVTDDFLEKLLVFPELQALDLRKTAISDRAARHLGQLVRLRSLNLFRTTIGDETLGQLRGLHDLETLLVGGTKITDAGLGQLVGLLELRKLSVFDTAIGDPGVAQLGVLPKLEILLISRSRVTEQGVRELQRTRPTLQLNEPT